MRRIFRAARRDELDVQQAARLVNILNQIVGCIRTGDLEERISQLEQLNYVQQP